MALKPEQIDRLLWMIKKTREVKMTCPECLHQLDWYVQSDADGAPIEGCTGARARASGGMSVLQHPVKFSSRYAQGD
jgi:hypothetical protein